jgi:hypothetical protein
MVVVAVENLGAAWAWTATGAVTASMAARNSERMENSSKKAFISLSAIGISVTRYNVANCQRAPATWPLLFVEQPRQLFDHRAAQLFGVHDRHRAAIVAGDVVADADRNELNR